ncbi:MAG: ArnT family glycosyltransferase [Thermoleophilia bacterium]
MAIIAIAVLALTLPFLNKAFDWDDREYIEFAQVFKDDPLKMHLENLDYKGHFYEQFRTSHPPGVSYYLAIPLKLGFEVSEPLFRTVFIVFPLLAGFSMYFLARRFTRYALPATLLLLFTPGFIITSHSLMGDMPGLSFWLLATALFVYGCDRDSWKLLAGAGITMMAGVMIAYQALSLLPLLLFYAIIRKRFRLKVFIPLLFPVAAFISFALFTRNRYGGWPVLSYNVGIRWGLQDFQLKIRAILVFIGGAAIFPLSVLLINLRRKIDLFVAFLLLPPLVTWGAVYYLGEDDLTLPQAMLLAIFLVAGFLMAYRMLAGGTATVMNWIRKKKESGDSLFLLAWFAGVCVYVAIFLPFVTVRFLLPLFPPMILVFMLVAGEMWPMRPRLRSILIVVTLAMTLAVGLIISVADYRFANSYREVSADIGTRYRGDGSRQLWVLSEFGPRYYLQQQGFEYLGPSATGEREPRKGDIVVISKIGASGVTGPLSPGSYRELETIEPDSSLPVRVMGEEAAAGFYAHLTGPLPWNLSAAPLDEIAVYELYWED